MSPRARRLAVIGTAVACAAGGALVFHLFRSSVPPPAPATVAPAKPPPAVSPPALTPPPPPPAPAVAPRAQVVSWSGLQIAPCESDLRFDPMVTPVLGRLDQDILAAVKDLKDASGLFPVAEDRVSFVPVSRTEASFREAYAAAPAEGGVRVDVPLEPLVLAWWPSRQVLASALAEAILLQEVPRYAQAPAWLRHGIALHLSRFGPTYANRAVPDSTLPPPQLVRPLDETGDLAWLDGYWAVRALSARRGDETVKRWMQRMFEGRTWTEALLDASGETPQVFQENYMAWATAHLRDRCANRQAVADAVALLRLQKEGEAAALLTTFVQNNPLDLYAGNAKYFLNYARFRLGDYEDAINGFTNLLVNDPATTTWQGKAHYFLGRSYQLAGYRPLALKEYMLAALDPDSALLRKLAKQHLAEVEE